MAAEVDEEMISDARATAMRRTLIGALAVAVLVLVVGVILAATGHGPVGIVIGLVLGIAAGGSLGALRSRGRAARRLSALTGVLFLVASVPLVGIGVGLLTALAGVGLLFVTLGPERQE